MKIIHGSFLTFYIFIVVLGFITPTAMAFDGQPTVLDLRFQPKIQHVFILTPTDEEESENIPLLLSRIEPAAAPANADTHTSKFKSDDETDFKDKLIEKIPFGDKMHHSWKIIDGDVDLYFDGLRADRGNKGVEYKSNTIPFIGKMDKSEWKVDAGEDMKFTFISKALPFVDDIEGFHFKTTISEDDNRAYARYTVAFD